MRWGIVSNCWGEQLRQGEPLGELVAEAAQFGYGTIELRQGSLGSYERGEDHVPDAERLAELAGRFPQVTFNLAMQLAWFDPGARVNDPSFQSGVKAATALAIGGPPHLRLVDLTTRDDGRLDADSVARRAVALTEPLVAAGGTLSLENAGQSWALTLAVLRAARDSFGEGCGHLQLCYDPCNLLSAADNPDLNEATASLAADELSMLHIKQRRGGGVQTDVGDGDVDWSAQFALLAQAGYDGPMLLEIAPHAHIWANLQRSRAYLESLPGA